MRDSSIFYRSFYEAINELPEANQLEVYKAIFEYSLNFKETELTGISKTIFTLIRPQLEANNKRYKNGTNPKTKQNESKTEAKNRQKISKNEANNNVNVNNNNNNNNNLNENIITGVPPQSQNIDLRIEKFKKDLLEYRNDYSDIMLKEFYNYWGELTKDGKKMRYENEKTWELKKRLIKWELNSHKFSTKKEDKPVILNR